MKKLKSLYLGAVAAACAILAALPVTAAPASAYVPEDAEIVLYSNIEAIFASPVLKNHGLDLQTMFVEAMAEEETAITEAPTEFYAGIFGVNEAATMGTNPTGIIVIKGSSACIDELYANVAQDDFTPAQIGSYSGYTGDVDDENVYVVKADPTVIVGGFGVTEAQFLKAVAGNNSNKYITADFKESLVSIAGDIASPETGAIGFNAALVETQKDIQLNVVADFKDEMIATAMEPELTQLVQSIPMLLASFGANDAVAAAAGIKVVREGSVFNITIPQVDVITASLVPVVKEMMAPQEIDWEDDDIDWEDDDIDWEDDDIDWEDDDIDWEDDDIDWEDDDIDWD